MFLVVLLVNGIPSMAQTTYQHYVFWGRLVLTDTINTKLRWELFLQKRTQSVSPSKNMFEAPHFVSYWLWFNYTVSPNLKISVSPFGYFASHVFDDKPGDTDLPSIKEFRYCLRFEERTPVASINIFNRQSIEYRTRDLFDNGHYIPNWRIRYMVRVEKNIISKPKPLTLAFSDEIFVQFGEAVKGNPNVFDQNRAYIGLAYEVLRNIKLSVGYMNMYWEKNSGKDFDDADCLWVILTFDNLFSQLRRK